MILYHSLLAGTPIPNLANTWLWPSAYPPKSPFVNSDDEAILLAKLKVSHALSFSFPGLLPPVTLSEELQGGPPEAADERKHRKS